MSEPVRRSVISRVFNGLWSVIVWAYRLVVMVLVFGSILWLIFGSNSSVVTTVEDQMALVIAPTGEIVEQLNQDSAQAFAEQFNDEEPSQTVLRDLVDALDAAKDDARIPLAVIKLDSLNGAGLAQLQELNAAIERFKAAGKPVYAHGESFEQGAYYVAAHASDVSMDPLGMVALEGLSSYQNYYKDGLDKLAVTVNVFRVGEFKSAVEPFIRNDMSAEAKAANLSWLGDLWAYYGQDVGRAREIPPIAINNGINQMPEAIQELRGDTAAYALKAKLINRIETIAQFRERIAAVVGVDQASGSFRQIWSPHYLQVSKMSNAIAEADQQKIALVVVEGEIIDGESVPGAAGGDSIYRMLDEARRDEDVRAVVLRVNSPGGSVNASEKIRRAVQALRAADKPVIASMSSVAASGGYWISMDANQILAHETTITGSIGIFGIIPTFEQSLAKLGVSTDGVGTTDLAGAMRLDRPLTAPTKILIQAIIEKGYRDFINGVAASRKLDVQAVDRIARGRVWSGLQAKKLGLIDAFGSLEDAAAKAAELAGLAAGSYRLEESSLPLESPLNALVRFLGTGMGQLTGKLSLADWVGKVPETEGLAPLLKAYNDPRGAYSRCFCSLDLKF